MESTQALRQPLRDYIGGEITIRRHVNGHVQKELRFRIPEAMSRASLLVKGWLLVGGLSFGGRRPTRDESEQLAWLTPALRDAMIDAAVEIADPALPLQDTVKQLRTLDERLSRRPAVSRHGAVPVPEPA